MEVYPLLPVYDLSPLRGPPLRPPWGPLRRLSRSNRGLPLLVVLLSLLMGLLLLGASPVACRVAFLSPQGGPFWGVSASLHADFAPWGPPVERILGQLLYKGSVCKADNPPYLSVSSLDFRPRILRLALLRGLGWLLQQLPEFSVPFLLPFLSDPNPAADIAAADVDAAAAISAAADAAAAGAAAADAAAADAAAAILGGEIHPTRGDTWRWAFSQSLASRKEVLASLFPFSSLLWTTRPLEGPPTASFRAPWSSLGPSLSRPELQSTDIIQQQQQQQQHTAAAATAAAAAAGEETGEETFASSVMGHRWGPRAAEGPLLFRSPSAPPITRKRAWLFDQCTEKELIELIDAANSSGVSALLLTDTPFRDYYIPLLGSAFAPKPLMPVASIPDSSLLQQIKRQSAAAAAAGSPPLLVFLDSLPPEAADCKSQELVLYVSLLVLPLWVFIAIWWNHECRQDRGRDTTALHKLLMLPPTLKAAAAAAQAAYCLQCPEWSTAGSQYLVMALMSLDTLFQTFFFASILLISKGYLIIRETFDRRESLTTALLVG